MKFFLKPLLIFLILNHCKAQISQITNFSNSAPFDANDNYRTVAAIGSNYFFTGSGDENVGNELFVSDGTVAGTKLVKDISPGSKSTEFNAFVVMKNKLYFIAETEEYGEELWTSDGTSAGTKLVKDINTTSSALNIAFTKLTVFKDKLYFRAFTSGFGSELWVSDGTESGTKIFKDILPGSDSANPDAFYVLKDKLYFFVDAESFVNPDEMWETDGTLNGTKKVISINEKNVARSIPFIAGNENLFYFTTSFGFNVELYKSDGTAAGTKFVSKLDDDVVSMVVLNSNKAVFTLSGGNNVDDLWASDGTEAGTIVLKDLKYFFQETPYSLIKFEDHAYCLANDEDDALVLKSDGTIAGTSTIATFETTTGGGKQYMVPFSKEFLIIAYKSYDEQTEIYTSKGTSASTKLLSNLNPTNGESSSPSDFRELENSNIIFKAEKVTDNRELFIYSRFKPLSGSILISKPIICNNDNTGQLSAIAENGFAPYAYEWSTSEKTSMISNLSAGQYKLTITDNSGNTFVAQANLSNPEILNLSASITDETPNSKNGKIDLIVAGGVTPYTFKWDNDKTTEDLNGLSAGKYNVTVTDKNGCTISSSYEIKIISSIGDDENCSTNIPTKIFQILDIKSCSYTEKMIEIFSLNGTMIFSSKFQRDFSLNTSDFLNGQYIVNVTDLKSKNKVSSVFTKM